MNSYKRPCLQCRALFIPTRSKPSHCSKHKPVKRSNKTYKHKGKRAYDDAEYRRNRALIRKQQRYCVWCGTAGTTNNRLYVDHIVPVSKGGSHKLENLRVLCQNCHKTRRGIAHR